MNSRSLSFIVSILPPSFFLLYLYQRNATYLSIWHTLIAIAIFTLVAIIIHLLILKLIKSSGTAALINNVLWILFFTIRAPYWLFNLIVRKNLVIYLSIIIIITIVIITLIIQYKKILQKYIIIKILFAFWSVIIIINIILTVLYTINNHSKYIADDSNYKTEFIVDTSLQSPNIYWLLMDGMLGFKAMEHLFNDPQPEFNSQLIERGFIINKDAQFEALHTTANCIPALMCPKYYDIYFVPKLKFHNFIDNELTKSSNSARVKNELILAFYKKGYKTSCIVTLPDIYYFTPDVLYFNKQKMIIKKKENNISDQKTIEKLFAFFSLLSNNTPLGKLAFVYNNFMNQYIRNFFLADIQTISSQPNNIITSFFGEFYQGIDKWYLSALTDAVNYSGPKLVILHDMKAHVPYTYNKQGKRNKQNILDPYNYPSQHSFASTIAISYIDFILNIDPEAIIVLQSDHGLHYERTKQLFIYKYGKIDEDVRLMQNQTISAIRIPEKWGGLEQPIEPLNITRLLVNKFVGENYSLLSLEDIIK